MKSPLKSLPQIEWDFRQVDDWALESATLYEYARTSRKLRESICGCLQTKIKGKRVAEHILAAIKTEHKTGTPSPDCYPDGVWEQIRNLIYDATPSDLKLAHIIMDMRPDFPAPWTAVKFKSQNKKSPATESLEKMFPNLDMEKFLSEIPKRLLINPLNNTLNLAKRAAKNSGDALKYIELISSGKYELSFWMLHGATIDNLVKDFEIWIRQEVKRHPENFAMMKRKGMAGQRPIAPLAWLSAYRFNQAGYTYDRVQEMLRLEQNHYGYFPKYADKSGWSNAINKAKKLLARLESGCNLS